MQDVNKVAKIYQEAGWDIYVILAAIALDKDPNEITEKERQDTKAFVFMGMYDFPRPEPIIAEEMELEHVKYADVAKRPEIACLCGSTRFGAEFEKLTLQFTLKGYIVLGIGVNMMADRDLFKAMNEKELRLTKAKLDVLHFAKIDLADWIFVINVNRYIGESTEREIEYARMRGKEIRYLEEPS